LPTNSIDALSKCADILFVNQKEFEEIGKRLPPDQDIDVARRIIDKLAPNAMIMLLKRYDEITAFLKLADRLVEYHYPTHTLEASEIEDATGAGDVFAGGFLVGQLQPAFTISHSIQMGARLVQTKLSLLSADSFSKFVSVYRELIDDIFNQYRSGTVGAGATRSRGKLLNVLLLLCAGAALAEAIANRAIIYGFFGAHAALAWSVTAGAATALGAWGLQRYFRLKGRSRLLHWWLSGVAAIGWAVTTWMAIAGAEPVLTIATMLAVGAPVAVEVIKLLFEARGHRPPRE
jgi:hypothetical protein